MSWGLFCLLTVLAMPIFAQEPVPSPLAIAIFPCTDVVSSFKKFYPLITYLNQTTHLNIHLMLHQDPANYERAIKNGELDFVLQDPHGYVRSAHLYNRHSLLRSLTMDGKTSQCGVVVVRKDGGIHSIQDLKQKTVMFGPTVSSARWIAARSLLKANGIHIESDLGGYSNGACCEDIAFNVYMHAVDAGVVCDHFLAEHHLKQRELGVDADQLMMIGITQQVPTKVLAAAKHVDPLVVASVNQALLHLDPNLPEHRQILNQAELGGFQETDDMALADIKKMLDAIAEE
ncbi:phosphate/phosphite/phosphonate ABC transporter substrate-binding protein [Desulfosarcina cetonica]|uniref:phosphate/phosphite/phosphonate ABC transporter substrate-binding protein n=1 Tax=Desulfosarcina cetonica TaxID=90730 RepID=UPI0006CFE36E|nr:phosphate/phosphite/phosphonate ABC transporter substrate-binding protein [Desulfosarcina cetonica]